MTLNPIIVERLIEDRGEEYSALLWKCPGCDSAHMAAVSGDANARPVWDWNGDLEAPTLSPSVRVISPILGTCHFFLRSGVVEFCGDSSHALAGKSAPLGPVPDWLTS